MRLERCLVQVLALALGSVVPGLAQPIGTAFTYQGRLTDGATPADGAFHFRPQVAATMVDVAVDTDGNAAARKSCSSPDS